MSLEVSEIFGYDPELLICGPVNIRINFADYFLIKFKIYLKMLFIAFIEKERNLSNIFLYIAHN
jgi:hypothetical protein